MSKTFFKPGTLLGPVPAVMVSLGEGDKKNIITIAWTGIINSDPAMTYISVRKSRHSYSILKETGEFVINLTTEDLAKATDYCGVKSGRDVDKFKEMNLTPGKCQEVKCPLIEESPLSLECQVTEVKELGSHDMFMAKIVGVNVSDELIDEDGHIALDKAHLLSFIHGEYFGIKKYPIGKFGFSVMKPKTRKRINRQTNNRYRGNQKRG
ncbi:MAG: flavin reductase family protein [Clostridia bacterium]|nr:flavin reductase family protein [Clostridia bacterium]